MLWKERIFRWHLTSRQTFPKMICPKSWSRSRILCRWNFSKVGFTPPIDSLDFNVGKWAENRICGNPVDSMNHYHWQWEIIDGNNSCEMKIIPYGPFVEASKMYHLDELQCRSSSTCLPSAVVLFGRRLSSITRTKEERKKWDTALFIWLFKL